MDLHELPCNRQAEPEAAGATRPAIELFENSLFIARGNAGAIIHYCENDLIFLLCDAGEDAFARRLKTFRIRQDTDQRLL